MIKTIAIMFLCNLININFIDVYGTECYVCDQSCDHPGAGDLKTCAESESGGMSGKDFVKGALNSKDNNTYQLVASELSNHGKDLGLNDTTMPSWASLTEWVCYKTMDKRRGCLIMGKGLCNKDKSVARILTDFGKKITDILSNIKDVAQAMFANSNVVVDEDQKKNITSWMVTNYFTKLANGSDKPEFRLDFCCEGSKCNSGSIILKSSAAVLILSILIFV